MPGLLDYGREYMPGTDQRSALEQLRGLLSVGAPAAQAVGGLLGYTPGQGQALMNERAAMSARLAANPGQRLSSLFPPTEPMPASEQFGAGLVGNFMAPIKAYHGSPHVFDKFSMDKIGTGEGAQAYGHGLYMAESPDVAKGYRDTLSKETYLTPAGAVWSPDQLGHMNVRTAARKNIDNLSVALDRAKSLLAGSNDQTRPLLERDIATLENLIAGGGVKKNEGALYSTTLDVEPEDLLDWDKPLSEQSPKVREALAKIAKQIDDADPGSHLPKYLSSDKARGDAFYQSLTAELRGQSDSSSAAARKAAEALRSAGISGIRYLDAGSRGAGDGSRNIVMFDDSLIRIDERNGKPLGLLTP